MAVTAHKLNDPTTARRQLRGWFSLICVSATLALASGPSNALESDAQAPIEVEADSTEFDNQAQRHTLRGDVQIRQGSMSINAERIVMQLDTGKLVEINAQGNPLSFSVQDDSGATVTAEANQLLYKPGESTLSLLGAARLLSDGRVLSGERIDYDIAKANVQALSGADTRVKVIIDPTATQRTSDGSGN